MDDSDNIVIVSPPLRWASEFSCIILRPETDLDTLPGINQWVGKGWEIDVVVSCFCRMIAGRMQAQQNATTPLSLKDIARTMVQELQRVPLPSKGEILARTYCIVGGTQTTLGTVVSPISFGWR